eukprot:Skav209439  [mRNA]  locus=scaffold805:198429:200684:- [translate_table: standard]
MQTCVPALARGKRSKGGKGAEGWTLLRKYRAQLDERRKAQLVESGWDLQLSSNARCGGPVKPALAPIRAEEDHRFEEIDKDDSGYIDWAEFKDTFVSTSRSVVVNASYAELLQVINVPFRELMDMLADIDRVRPHIAILQEKLRLDREAAQEAEAVSLISRVRR